MKLRNFLYLNTKVIADYVAAIDGYTYDEETQAIATSSENTIGAKGGVPILNGSGAHTERKKRKLSVPLRLLMRQNLTRCIST